MSKRRTFGSVRRLPSGRWQASYHHPVTHQRVSGPTTYTTKREATTWLALAEADLVRGDDLDPNSRSRLFKPYAAEWLAGKVELRRGEVSTEYTAGENFFIPAGLPHAAKVHAGYKAMMIFNAPDRYVPKV